MRQFRRGILHAIQTVIRLFARIVLVSPPAPAVPHRSGRREPFPPETTRPVSGAVSQTRRAVPAEATRQQTAAFQIQQNSLEELDWNPFVARLRADHDRALTISPPQRLQGLQSILGSPRDRSHYHFRLLHSPFSHCGKFSSWHDITAAGELGERCDQSVDLGTRVV